MSPDQLSAQQSAVRNLVDSIAKSHGYLGEAVYARMDPDTRRKVQEALLAKDRMIGSSVMLLARELYSKDVRFIFELLQNADDNHYANSREAPYVAFHLYKSRVVIECNEDGFDEANLRAICNIGKSSKVNGHGYIGEKGIGFKSVFKVAWKAHIQSGEFSFAFIHRPGDSGMGMISPEWESYDGEAAENLTRITLHLLDDDEAAARHENIALQLSDLESNMLLFLKNIQRIHVAIYNAAEEVVSSTTMTVTLNQATNIATLRKSQDRNETSEETLTYCHVTKHQATGLKRSSNRTYTEAEEAAKSYRKAEVILAFPLSEDCVPIIEAQQVFAFLPLRRLGFTFLIQTDFVTMANREDVVASSTRNLALLDGIADAFIQAVHQMYSHETLRYQWMRYLHSMKSYPWDSFWEKLVSKIESKVRSAEILQPRRGGPPRLIGDLRRLSSSKIDSGGNPLFNDLPGDLETYISTGYRRGDLDILKDFGLLYLDQAKYLRRVKHDLRQPNSRMKNAETDDYWHTRAAMSLSTSFIKNWDERIAETRDLSLLPLNDGRWVSATREVYFPKISDGIIIPSDLGLKVLALYPCQNTARAELFTYLGAKRADVDGVRSRILQKYSRSDDGDAISLEASHSHLVFLYHTHQSVDASRYHHIKLYDTEGRFLSPAVADYYFTSEEPHSLWQLCQQNQDPWFTTHISFINSRYLQDPPDNGTDVSWKEWLALVGVRDNPRLTSRESGSLSPLCLHVAEALPSEFLEFLRCAWKSEEDVLLSSGDAVEQMKLLKVQCDGYDKLYSLSRTYLPLPKLQERCSDIMQEDFFPFLYLGESWSSDKENNWVFLTKHLGVGADDNLKFYIDMLYWIQEVQDSIDNPSRILDVYSGIHSRCAEARDQLAARKLVRRELEFLVYLPQYDDEEGVWANAEDCLGNAPLDMQYKYPIIARYEAAFPGVDLNTVTRFFLDTLNINQCSWKDVVEDLKVLKSRDISDFDRICSRYVQLSELCSSSTPADVDMEKLRNAYESQALLFVQNEHGQYKWVKPSLCLWSSATEIRHKVSLNNYYDDDLEDFFVTVLGVSRLTIDMVYDELYTVDPASTSVKLVKDYLWSMNAFLETGLPAQSSERLLKKRILPIRYPDGDTRLVAANIEFAIVDRQPLQDLFRDRVKLLDFSLGEVHELRPLLDWMNLTDRFLSRLTTANTIVNPDFVYPLTDPVRAIRRKAHALTRVAVHLKSPRTRSSDATKSFYALLLGIETWETNGISSILTVHQGSPPPTVELERAEVHITTSEKPLKIYVPHDKMLLDVCFYSALPEQLVRWMATDPITQQPVGKIDESAIKVVTGILATGSVEAMSRILDMQGIIDIDIPVVGVEEVLQDELPQAPGLPLRLASPSTPSSSSSDAGRCYGASIGEDGRFSPQTSHRAYQHHRQPDTFHNRPETPSHEDYRTLLGHVVACARTTCFPHQGTASASTHAGRHLLQLPSGRAWLLRGCLSSFERDCKIGAAGELFTFELLASLIENFGRSCWQSTMRRFVAGATGHPDYADMEPWNDSGAMETSDIVYDDTNGIFTDLLVEGRYLDAAEWAQRRGIRYYIEVKSTFGECDGPFYVSDRQRKMMRELMTNQSVYLIFRVFNMTSGSIGAKIYVDPDKMERQGLLKFSTDCWIVTPGAAIES